MSVQILTGTFKDHLNEAGNDFESMTIGNIEQLTGSDSHGDCEIFDDQGAFVDHNQDT